MLWVLCGDIDVWMLCKMSLVTNQRSTPKLSERWQSNPVQSNPINWLLAQIKVGSSTLLHSSFLKRAQQQQKVQKEWDWVLYVVFWKQFACTVWYCREAYCIYIIYIYTLGTRNAWVVLCWRALNSPVDSNLICSLFGIVSLQKLNYSVLHSLAPRWLLQVQYPDKQYIHCTNFLRDSRSLSLSTPSTW
jgi:hypothetical protein